MLNTDDKLKQTTDSTNVKGDLQAPVPQRKYNLGDLGFMQYEGVKFYSENIHLAHNRTKLKNSKVGRNISFREVSDDKEKKRKRKEQILKKQAKFNIKLKIEEEPENNFDDEIKLEDDNKGEEKDTKGSSSKDQSANAVRDKTENE